jgi:hypothetical protein
MNTVSLSFIEPSRVVAISGNVHYLWTKGAESWEAKSEARRAYEDANKGANVISLSGVNTDYSNERAYLFYVADCFDPPVYLVFGSSFEDAYDTFITEFERLILIEESDLKDYDENNLTFNDNGTAVDTESVQSLPVESLILTVDQPAD